MTSNVSDILDGINKRREQLQVDLKKTTDLSSLKEKVLGLKDDIKKLGPKLSPHEREFHDNSINKLIGDINHKLNSRKSDSLDEMEQDDVEQMEPGTGKLSQFSDQFNTKRKQLQSDFENNTNMTTLKSKVVGLKEDLQRHAPDLSAYEIELHNKNINKLVKDIDTKLKVKENSGKVFKFAKTPITKLSSIHNVRSNNILDGQVRKGEPEFIEEDFVLLDSSKIYKNLKRCTVSSADYNGPAKSGSLTFQWLDNCVVSLHTLPFKGGSVQISDCSNCVILLNLPADDKVQLRLHNLDNCKLQVQCDDYLSSRQTVIVENFNNCIFHMSCKSQINIENFNNVTKGKTSETEGEEAVPEYNFDEFNTHMGNIQELKNHYIH